MKARALTKRESEELGKAFLGRWAERNRALWMFLYYTGFRVSEALSRNVGDILDEGGCVADEITVEARHMKGKGESRTTPTHPELKEELEALLLWLAMQGRDHKSAPLFPCPSGRLDRKEAWRILKVAGLRAGIKVKGLSPHSGRKSLGYDALEFYEAARAKGEHIEPLLMVKEVLGHKRLDSTEHYLPRFKGKVKDAFMGR